MSVAKTGMVYGGNPSNTYQAMKNLFNYLNDKTTYDYYANTHRGAYGVWRDKAGNCCDMAHLMIACSRSLGVPGRYRHGYCHFSSMSTGHVWADVFCGKQFASYDNYNSDGWLTADLVSYYNYLGYKTNRTSYFYGSDKCAELPF
jgi:transglutaminase-like putative cysteine protease